MSKVNKGVINQSEPATLESDVPEGKTKVCQKNDIVSAKTMHCPRPSFEKSVLYAFIVRKTTRK